MITRNLDVTRHFSFCHLFKFLGGKVSKTQSDVLWIKQFMHIPWFIGLIQGGMCEPNFTIIFGYYVMDQVSKSKWEKVSFVQRHFKYQF